MKKIIFIIALLFPSIAYGASYPASWSATSTTQGWISPNRINNILQTIVAKNFIATSTATSTFNGPIKSTCFSTDGSTCITGGGGGGTPSTPDTSIQFNNAGNFGGSSNFTWANFNTTQTITSNLDGTEGIPNLNIIGDSYNMNTSAIGGQFVITAKNNPSYNMTLGLDTGNKVGYMNCYVLLGGPQPCVLQGPGGNVIIGGNDLTGYSTQTNNKLYINSGNMGFGTFTDDNDKFIEVIRSTNSDRAAGAGLQLGAEPALLGSSDTEGGGVYLNAGVGTGLGESKIHFLTGTPNVISGTTDNSLTEKVTILGSGNTGFGITAPTAGVHVVTPAGTESLKLAQGASDTWSLGPIVGDITKFGISDISSGKGLRMAIDTNGNVGIGTSSPYAKLSVVGPVVASHFIATSSTVSSFGAGGISSAGTITTSGGLTASGVIQTNGGSFNTSSSNTALGSGYLQTKINFLLAPAFPTAALPATFIYDISNNGSPVARTSSLYNWNTVNIGKNMTGASTWGESGYNLALERNVASFVATTTQGGFLEWGNRDGSSFGVIDRNGYIGIGTTSPSTNLTVYKASGDTAAILVDAVSDAVLQLNKSALTKASYVSFASGGVEQWITGSTDSNNLPTGADFMIGTSKSDAKVYIQSTGNVGIGSTTPYSKLSVAGSAAFNGSVLASTFNATSTTVQSNFAGGLVSGGELMVSKDAAGAIGPNITLNNPAGGAGWGSIINFKQNTTQQGYLKFDYRTPTTWTMGLSTNGSTDAMTIDGSGNIGVATSTPKNKLDVNGFINTDLYSGYKQNGVTILYASSTNNTAIGANSLDAVNSGNGNNTATGYNSLTSNTSGAYNTMNGSFAGSSNTTGWFNTAIGNTALYSNSVSDQNTAVGEESLYNTTGASNTALGYKSLFSNTSGGNNIGIGSWAGAYETGSNAFYVDYYNRSNTAGDKANAILYGEMNTTAITQKLHVNAVVMPVQAPTASAPAYVRGGMYFDTTLNKMRIGGATAWETVTSI